ncbi:MAG: hypothetical protein ACFN3A_02235 [Candidatus Nanosyncoccus sp.]
MEISKKELSEIIESYGFDNLVFDSFKQVEPDTALYIFHDERGARYCLIVADFLTDDIEMPCDFIYDYYTDTTIKFRAIKQYSYIENASKKANGYIDDKKHLTKTSTGDICILLSVDNLEY